MRTFVIPFYFGSGFKSGSGMFGSAKAKSSGSDRIRIHNKWLYVLKFFILTQFLSREFSHLEHIVGPVVAVPELGAGTVVAQAELYPGADGQRAHHEAEGELVGEAVAGAGDVDRPQLRHRAPVVEGPADSDRLVAGLAIKNPPKKTQKNHLKKPIKMFFFVFFLILIFLYKNNTNFSL
jgi:hypothetical protein